MAKVDVKMPEEFLLKLSKLGSNTDAIAEKVLEAGGEVVLNKVKSNLASVVGKDTKYKSRSSGELEGALGLSSTKPDKNGNAYGKHGTARKSETHIVLRSPQLSRPHGLAHRRHAASTERHAEDQQEHLYLEGNAYGGLHLGRELTCGPDIGKIDDDGTQEHHHLRPYEPPDGAEGHLPEPYGQMKMRGDA